MAKTGDGIQSTPRGELGSRGDCIARIPTYATPAQPGMNYGRGSF